MLTKRAAIINVPKMAPKAKPMLTTVSLKESFDPFNSGSGFLIFISLPEILLNVFVSNSSIIHLIISQYLL